MARLNNVHVVQFTMYIFYIVHFKNVYNVYVYVLHVLYKRYDMITETKNLDLVEGGWALRINGHYPQLNFFWPPIEQ